MSIAVTMLPEFDQEMSTTRRLIERVPTAKGEWKPHEKSFALGHLTQFLAIMPGWIARCARGEDVDLAAQAGYSFERTEDLLALFDRNVAEGHEALAAMDEADSSLPWSLKHGEQPLLTLPRAAALRLHISHLIHHRGQLSVYLRLIDVPVPSIYGPSADER